MGAKVEWTGAFCGGQQGREDGLVEKEIFEQRHEGQKGLDRQLSGERLSEQIPQKSSQCTLTFPLSGEGPAHYLSVVAAEV